MHLNRKKMNSGLRISLRSSKPQIKKSIKKELKISSNSNKDINKWKNILNGDPAFIIGNAPSLLKQDLSLLNNYFTIGLNRIFYVFDPIILFWQDRQIWNENKKRITELKSIKVSGLKNWSKYNNEDIMDQFFYFSVGKGAFRMGNTLDTLNGLGNSGALAAQLAMQMGCSSIILLGMDCSYSNNMTDFYGINKDHNKYTLNMCKKGMNWLINNSIVPVYNCGDGDYLPKISLEEAISKTNPIQRDRNYFLKLLF